MSWIFSRALIQDYESSHCSQAQEAESSEGTSSAGEQCAQLSVMPTQHKFWRNDKTMEPSQLSRFGLTCAVLTESHGEALLTWFREASRARTYPPLERAQESMGNAPGCGEKWRESSVRYDLDSSSWKIHLSLFPEDLPWSSVILPKWGMTRNGFVYQHPTRERPISATEYGLWQTPVADDAVSRAKGKWNSRGEPKLSGQVLSPAHWPTPNASDGRKWSNQSLAERKAKGQQVRLNTAVSPDGGAGGLLSPTWVEWLMGWPLGWTDLKPLEMARFHEWRQQHSIF